MRTNQMIVSPKDAAALLCRNVGNRKLNKTTVKRLADAMLRGEWMLTHQGIAVSLGGQILDGQHRLSAIVMAGVSVPLLVTTDVDERTFKVIDRGMARSLAVALGATNPEVAVATIAHDIHKGMLASKPTPQELRPYLDAISDPYRNLVDSCAFTSRLFSSAPVKAAAVLRLMEGRAPDYVIDSYSSLAKRDYLAMSPMVLSFYRQVEGKKIGRRELYARAFRAFDENDRDVSSAKFFSVGPASYAGKQIIERSLRSDISDRVAA